MVGYIEILVVLFFTYLVMSTIVSTTQEVFAQALHSRSRNLRDGVIGMLTDKTYNKEIANRFFSHPMLASLSGKKAMPSYISPEAFTSALASALAPKWLKEDPVANLPLSIAAMKDGELKRKLQLIIAPPGAGRPEIELDVKSWFDSSIDKISKRYKSDVRRNSYIMAFALTAIFNVSTIEIVKTMWEDAPLRTYSASVIRDIAGTQQLAASDKVSGDSDGALAIATAAACLRNDLGIPIGWQRSDQLFKRVYGWVVGPDADGVSPRVNDLLKFTGKIDESCSASLDALGLEGTDFEANLKNKGYLVEPHYGPQPGQDPFFLIFLGWVITAIAVAQGAPFWFDMLQRLTKR